MSSIIPFQFETHAVRVQTDDAGQPWFNANDVCAALELANPRDALAKHVDSDDVAKRDIIDSLGRVQLASFVNESGLYVMICGPGAKAVLASLLLGKSHSHAKSPRDDRRTARRALHKQDLSDGDAGDIDR